MSTKSEIRLVSTEEYKELPTTERIYFHMLDPFYYQLNGKEIHYFEELKKVFLLMSEEMSEKRIRKRMYEIMPTKAHYFTKYMNDVEEVFGRIRKHTKEFQKSLQRERLKGYITSLKKEQPKGYLDSIAKFEDMLMKLDGLHLPDIEAAFDWSQLMLPPVTYSSSTAFLSGMDVEDIEILQDDEV